MDQNLKRTLILEHYKNPFHKEKKEGKFDELIARRSSCIDDLSLQISYEAGKIKDIYFEGEACVISTSSTSMLLSNLIGKTKDEALKFIDNFEKMINEEEYDAEALDELIVFDSVYKQPNRKACALLTSSTIKKYLLDKGE